MKIYTDKDASLDPTLTRGKDLLNKPIRDRMEQILLEDIKRGDFIKEWSSEQAGGSKTLADLRAKAMKNAMSQAEDLVIPVVQRAHNLQEGGD